MVKKTFEIVNENVYYEKLPNGIEVFLYPTNKTKNFYMSISVKYGAKVTKYKKDNKEYSITPGVAHFLEHKVMALSENEDFSKRINKLGSLANAWTSYDGTNYNIFGSINIRENLKLLLDIFYNIDINEKSVEEEKGIIAEEIDMYDDQIGSLMQTKLFRNLFNNSYVINTVTGKRDDIYTITAEELNRVYNDFYTSNNTFIIVTGNFDVDTIMNDIKEYMNNIDIKPKELPKVIKEREKDKVFAQYEEVQKDVSESRVRYGIKIPKKVFGIKNDTLLKSYLNIILSSNFSSTSELYEKYKNENLFYSLSYGLSVIDNYVVLIINAVCKDGKLFIERIKDDIKKMSINEETFERKKKLYLKEYILGFEDISDIEYDLCLSILFDNKIDYKEYSLINNMNYDEAKRVLGLIDTTNYSVVKTSK